MLDSWDESSYLIDDQFLIGDKIMVAPILAKGQVQRDVYLPKILQKNSATGILEEADVYWKNRDNGRIYGSGEWLRNVKVKQTFAIFH